MVLHIKQATINDQYSAGRYTALLLRAVLSVRPSVTMVSHA